MNELIQLLKKPAFIFIWLGQAASGLGGTFAMFIMSWLVYEMTGSLLAMGSMWVSFMVPSLITQLWSGPYLDRWNRKTVMVVSEWMRVFAFLIPAVLYFTGSLEVWHLYLTTIIGGIAEPLFRPSSMAYVAEILPKDKLLKGNSILEGTMQIMMLIGPPLGGLMLQWFGAQTVLSALVICMAVAGCLLMFLPKFELVKGEKKETWLKQFVKGLQFYKVNRVLLYVGLLLMILNFCSGASQPMFLPFVTEILGGSPFQYGLFTSSFSIGMILASLWAGTSKEPKSRRLTMLGALLIGGVCMAILGLVELFALVVVVMAINGFCMILFNIHNSTLYQQRVPNEVRGRVFAVRIFLAQAGMPFGALFGGAFADAFGIQALFVLLGAIIIVVNAVALMLPVFKQLDTTETMSTADSETAIET